MTVIDDYHQDYDHEEPDPGFDALAERILSGEIDDGRSGGPTNNGHAPAPNPISVDRFVRGGSFILDVPAQAAAIWGHGTEMAWASGEPVYLTGAIGIGKTTLMQRLALARIGVTEATLLGLPVAVSDTEGTQALYLASDRPDQAARSFYRMVTEDDRQILDERLVIWKGPPGRDLAKHPETLVEMIEASGATDVFLDSLKDMAVGLADDEVGAGLNIAVQLAIAEGFQVAGAHHPRKKQQGSGARPKDLDDIYGSTWITGGAGSVIHLHGEPGSLVSTLLHLKAPHDKIGPFDIALDLDIGSMTIAEEVDLFTLAGRADNGITANAAAIALYGPDPDKSEVERARRKLKKHPYLEEHEVPSTSGGTPPKLYRQRASGVTQGVTQGNAA